MNESQRLASQLGRALNGGAWHGPSWREALDGLTRAEATRRPIPAAHNIAEIVVHAATWHDVVRRRLIGEVQQVADDEDWKPAMLPDDAAWSAAIARLNETGEALKQEIERFPAERLLEIRPGVDDTWFGLILGELQHVLYHAGQVGILRKAGAPAPLEATSGASAVG
jgi:hypothetical protein